MLRLKRVVSATSRNVYASNFLLRKEVFPISPLPNPSQWTSTRSLDIYKMGSKKELEKERARIKDEMNRGYFADMSEFKQHGGKISEANKVIIQEMVAVKFPTLEVNYSDGSVLKLPITDVTESTAVIPKASLLCLSFRASSQPLVDSWSSPFLNTFRDCGDVQFLEISFIDSWLLRLSPIKKLLLKIMKKPKAGEEKDVLKKQIVYAFGDHYYFRKELHILNLLTGYIFLIDKLGRIRWQGSGLATPDELSSLMSCTSLLLKE